MHEKIKSKMIINLGNRRDIIDIKCVKTRLPIGIDEEKYLEYYNIYAITNNNKIELILTVDDTASLRGVSIHYDSSRGCDLMGIDDHYIELSTLPVIDSDEFDKLYPLEV
jgi:hypothetical protein